MKQLPLLLLIIKLLMKQLPLLLLIIGLVLHGAPVAVRASNDQRMTALMDLLSGNFDAGRHRHDQRLGGVPEDELDIWASRSFAPMNAPAIGTHVMLSASYNRYDGECRFDPFEFLVWNLVPIPGSDDILMLPKSPIGPEAYKRIARVPGILDGIQQGALVNGVGGAACPIRWTKTDDGYRGISRDCLVMSVSQLKVLSWNWTYVLKGDRLEIELAGRDKDDGTLLFGSGEGNASILYRLSDISEYEAARYMLEKPSSDADIARAEALLRDVVEKHKNHAGAQTLLDGLPER